MADGAQAHKPEAIDGLQRHRTVLRRFVEADAEQLLEFCGDRVAAHRLAGLGPAELQHMPAGGMVAVVVIEGDDAMHLGPGDVQRLGDDRQGFGRHIAELVLNAVQDRQQRAFEALQLLDDRRGARRDLGTCMLHGQAAPSLS